MTPLLTVPHFLLALAGVSLAGVGAYAETHPQSPGADEDSRQLLRVAKYIPVGLVVMITLIIVGLELGTFHLAKAVK
jgi:hypothetical protein